jgi:hypothetical protein
MATPTEKNGYDKAAMARTDERSNSEPDVANQHQIIELDNFKVLGLSPEDADFYLDFSSSRRKKLLRKIDVRLIPMLATLYLISHIDRANIGVSPCCYRGSQRKFWSLSKQTPQKYEYKSTTQIVHITTLPV